MSGVFVQQAAALGLTGVPVGAFEDRQVALLQARLKTLRSQRDTRSSENFSISSAVVKPIFCEHLASGLAGFVP